MFEFVIYIDMVERVSYPLPNIMYVYVVHALRAFHYKSKADLCLYIYINSC